MKRYKTRFLLPYTILIIALFVALGAVFVGVLGSVKREKSDADLFTDLKTKCDRLYEQDVSEGVFYARYPCADEAISAEFRNMYGRSYSPGLE